MYTHLKIGLLIAVAAAFLGAGCAQAVTNFVDRSFTGTDAAGDSWVVSEAIPERKPNILDIACN